MTRVLVTGAAGFVGLPVVAELVRRGTDVHALCTHSPPRGPAHGEALGACWHRVDLGDEAAVALLMGELAPERLVHLAWYTAPGRFWGSPENLLWVGRSLGLLRAFVRHGGRRLTMLGSCAEYDWLAAAQPLSEARSRAAPSTLYGVAKDALRRVAAAYATQEEVELAWGRLFFLYGPREHPARLVPSVIRALRAGERMELAGGERVRDFMYIEDVARAVVALLDSPVVGEVNIGSGVGVKVGDVVERIVRSIGGPSHVHPGAPPGRPDEPPSLVADVTRLRDEVGYRPHWTLAAGLDATVRWWEMQDDPIGPRSDRPSQGDR
jgi:nucleoside-diphosphate-sugar epimerase